MNKGRWIRGGNGSHWNGCSQSHWDCMEKELLDLKDFYRWRKYPEEKPEERGVYQIRCDLHKGHSLVGTWIGKWRVFDGKEWRMDIEVTHFTNLTPIEDK